MTQKKHKYYDLLLCAFVTVLICSNVIGVSKIVDVNGFTFGAGILFFPLSYLFGDILTEVYGYAHDRRAVWAGFAALAFASFMSAVIVGLPAAPGWPHQDAYVVAFGQTWRIAASSLLAFWAGSFINAFVMAKMKILTKGKNLWMRTIGSTIAGEAIDTMIFYPLAFMGDWDVSLLIKVMGANYCMKVMWEVVMTPVTYKVVAWLKKKENEDHFDHKTNFTPFSLKTN